MSAYFNVSFHSRSLSDKGISLLLQLETEKLKCVKWESSKRLLYGSLVCLSKDMFNENFILAVICDRDPKNLKKGIISVILEEQNGITIDEESLINEASKYIMFETNAYYEAYCHVLNALKSLKEDNFPFKSQIVDCRSDLKSVPEYILKSPLIDLRTLVTDVVEIDKNTGNYLFDPSLNYAMSVLFNNEAKWPSPTQMKLDQSQYQAIKLALTQNICLIQGPPGKKILKNLIFFILIF